VKLKVTEQGVLIPKELLGNSLEVEISKQEEKIIITIINNPNSIWDLGVNPVENDITDGAINHDKYLYNP
jgi:virulence-associated protein VagC